ncbi:glycosyl transferase [Luteimonas terricola]|uniref:glycosyl transferase n=1 Tax=Luteimonas terricola TaxID=645597 RepID=UPI00104E97BA|nr:glycosyl transferase [Luteimonas terricola]
MAAIDWIRVLPWLAVVAAMAATGAWLARRHALRHGLLDQPGERRSHAVPTPRGGGIGIAVAWAMACIASGLAGVLPGPLALAAVCGVVLVGSAGYVDDHRPLSPWWRLAAHVAAGAALAAGLVAAGAAPWLAPLALVGAPVMVNVWNFMDGIDGLATTQAALAALAFALLAASPLAALPALALAAACLGFLPFNFPRARIFLGDVGSGVLGFALTVLAALLVLEGGALGGPGLLPVLFLPVSAFLIDAALTLGGRIVRRERWWTAHVGHAYQRLAAGIGSHVPVTAAYGVWTLAAIALACAANGQGLTARMAAAGSCGAVGALAWRIITSHWPLPDRKCP